MEFDNGDKVYVGSRLVGLWVGMNPVTESHVVYDAKKNEYKSFHEWQIKRYPVHEVSFNALWNSK